MEEIKTESHEAQKPLSEHVPQGQNPLKKIVLGFVAFFIIAGIAYGGYYFGQQSKAPSKLVPPTYISPILTPTDQTANWKTYSNSILSFSYPSHWKLKASNLQSFYLSDKETGPTTYFEYAVLDLRSPTKISDDATDEAIIEAYNNYYSGSTSGLGDYSPKLTAKEEIKVGGKRAIKYSFTLQNAYDGSGHQAAWIFIPERPKMIKFNWRGEDYTTLNQILSTFKFTDQNQSESSTQTPEKIPLVSTANWKTVTLNGISFKIPPSYKCNDDNNCTTITPPPPSVIPINTSITAYKGGSRREQYYEGKVNDEKMCKTIYQEGVFGSVSGLQIAVDGGLCQGTGSGATVVVIGKNLVEVQGRLYQPETKHIMRESIKDTIISTLKLAQ